jgi:hypothetical protein
MMADQSRYRRALKLYNRRARIAVFLDRGLERVAKRLPLCGQGKRHNWSVLIAQMFMTDCWCCYFYRGVALGFIIFLLMSALCYGALYIFF